MDITVIHTIVATLAPLHYEISHLFAVRTYLS